MRWYKDQFREALDNRSTENYMRYLARVHSKIQVNPQVNVYIELLSFTENNPISPVRNIAGTGKMTFGISHLFSEFIQPDFLFFDVLRLRVGRQQFPIGKGLSLGESYYFVDKFDGARIDLAFKEFNLSLFGAITGQNVSDNGLYPDPGSDQIYVARLSRPVLEQNVMVYAIYHNLRGVFNDSYIVGGGLNGDFFAGRLEYFGEGAYQTFNTAPGLPEKGGLGLMGGVSYRTALGPMRSVKIETRYAAYQGDDAKTEKIEQFSPLYPSFFWGSRRGYVNGEIGGDFPFNGRHPEGSGIWFSRIYFIPKWLPTVRLQFEFINVNEFVNNDNYNSMDNEFAVKLYYKLSSQTQLQFRYALDIPDDEDKDLNDSGLISWSEDRVRMQRFMMEYRVKF